MTPRLWGARSSIVTLLKEEIIAAGKGPIRFLSLTLYTIED
jgi:hypothetical protein